MIEKKCSGETSTNDDTLSLNLERFDFSFRNISPFNKTIKPRLSSYPNTVSSYLPTQNSLTTNQSRWNTRVALPDQSHLTTREMDTGRSPRISHVPTRSPLPGQYDLNEDVILAGSEKRSFYPYNPKPPTSCWSDFRSRHLNLMQEKNRIHRHHNTTTTSDDTTSPSSSISEGESSMGETELMIHAQNPVTRQNNRTSVTKPLKPPRLAPTRIHIGSLETIESSVLTDHSKSSSPKSSSNGMTPAPPPPPMPPMKSFANTSRHVGHITGITETLQNRMANAALSAASEARARKISKL